ncbi:MAG: DUF2520 domain-containing protein [Ferruginibacter sp.]|nr:DUF2520 domain-containing protein [Cytophagales bacterium]
MKTAFIGSGNLAWHLSRALEAAHYPIADVYSRRPERARQLANHLHGARVRTGLDFSDSPARLFFLTVSDDAIPAVASALVVPPGSTVVHTSGSQSLAALRQGLRSEAVRAGVLYPLQTFSHHQAVDFSRVPLCLEGEDPATEATLMTVAQGLSHRVEVMDSARRRVLHLGAVMAGNFTNHLLVLAKRVLDEENLELDLLKPLLEETVRKAFEADDPAGVQTGPAWRGDVGIIGKHLDHLANRPNLQAVYRQLTESIRNTSSGTIGRL